MIAEDIPLIIVGAVNLFGNRTPYSQGTYEEISVSAVGNVNCPNSDGETVTPERGTSFGMTQSLWPRIDIID
jgi:hypothetical protein